MARSPIRDGLAGLSVAGLMVPEAVAYAAIAGLAPGRALVAGIAGGIAYVLVGRSRFAIVSPTSSSAVILAAALGSLSADPATRDMMATAMTLAVGALFAGLALFRLGSLAGFVSRPVLRGFAFGLAITIIVKQLPKLAGVAVPAGSIGSVVLDLARQLPDWHWASVALGVGALGALLGLRRFRGLPAAFIVIVAGIALSLLADLRGMGIALAGPAPLAMPSLALPQGFQIWGRIAQLAAPVTLIIFAESWGTMRNLALRHGDTLSPNRELGAIGFANAAAALVQGMPIGAGFSGCSANEAAGAQSRLAALVASLSVLALALFAGSLIARIPEPVLAAIVIGALTHALSPAPLIRLFRIGRDQWIGLAAALGVLALGVLDGMLLAIGLSIAELLYRLSHPLVSELGQVRGGHDFVDIARHADAERIAGVAIYRPNAPLFFANSEASLRAIGDAARKRAEPVLILSLEESNDLDSTAVEALGEFAQSLKGASRRLILARAHDRVRDVLSVAGLSELAEGSTFSVADAAAQARQGASR
ncbi:MAG: SulP family inorganic anion transporter [Sphingomonadales bacterium]|nr:SulP family inorganic anion transporter [Sphingomonadales bacterium]MDE2569557.1 SulP family inorganic anion transporter [Sphingomonadales bacterium]